MGKNGAGKTTLLQMVAGVMEPDSGSVTPGARLKMGYFAQQALDPLSPDLTIEEQLHRQRREGPAASRCLSLAAGRHVPPRRRAAGVPGCIPEAGHNVEWWPQERPRIEALLVAHPRAAHPQKVSWETERTDRYNRFRWLTIDRLGMRGSDVRLEDVNTFHPSSTREVELFDRRKPSGRVDAERNGNVFEVKTRGVQQFTLLISSDAIDFTKPVHVTVNGRPVHDAIVKKDVATLHKWADRDNDRTMLYGAELTIAVP